VAEEAIEQLRSGIGEGTSRDFMQELRHARSQQQAYLQRYRQHYEEIAATDQLFIAC
jgi:hypothetical protein